MLRRTASLCVGLVMAAGALSGCGSGLGDGSGSTVTVTAAPPSHPLSHRSTSRAPTGHGPSSEPAPSTPAEGAGFTMPDEVGKVLQDAQDDIQRVSHDPVFYTSSKDATGRGRHQLLDRDWKVCAQNVRPGQVVERKTALITFSVVKLDEPCP